MATDDEMCEAMDALDEAISEVADDTDRWNQQQSMEIYSHISDVARMRADLIKREMG